MIRLLGFLRGLPTLARLCWDQIRRLRGQRGQRETWPETVHSALRDLADWLDEADRLIDRLAESRGLRRPNSGDEVQQDMRRLADWFTAHPEAAADAWAHVRDGAR